MHHHGGGRVELLVKNDNAHKGGFAVRQDDCVAQRFQTKLARERFQAIEPNAIEDFKIIRPAGRVVLWHMDQSTSSWIFTSLVETHR